MIHYINHVLQKLKKMGVCGTDARYTSLVYPSACQWNTAWVN